VNLSQGRASGSGSNEFQAKERVEEEKYLPKHSFCVRMKEPPIEHAPPILVAHVTSVHSELSKLRVLTCQHLGHVNTSNWGRRRGARRGSRRVVVKGKFLVLSYPNHWKSLTNTFLTAVMAVFTRFCDTIFRIVKYRTGTRNTFVTPSIPRETSDEDLLQQRGDSRSSTSICIEYI
jgi:hypothetical protein